MARDTLRQARASGLLWAVLVATGVVASVCLTLSVSGDSSPIPLRPWENRHVLPASEAARLPPGAATADGVDVPAGEMSLLFGTVRWPLNRTRADGVRVVEIILAAGLADTAGVMLALLWTSAFLPAFFDPAAVSVLIAKPVPRWALFAGKVIGIIAFVALCGAIYLGATGVALGVATNVWDGRYYAALPILLVHFAAFFAVSALLAAWTRNTVIAGLGTAVIWFACWAINYAHATAPGGVVDVAYWLLPKPADLGALLFRVLGATDVSAAYQATPELSVVTSLVLPLVGIIVAGRIFQRADY